MEVAELRDRLMFLWREYGNADRSNMTDDAKELAEEVRRLFQDVADTYLGEVADKYLVIQ